MPTPTAAELVSGFWASSDATGPVDAYAAAAYAQGGNGTGLGVTAPVRGWRIRADDAVTPGPDGRPTVGYPIPAETPVWVAADLAGGLVWAVGTDFTVADDYVWFVVDPLAAAPTVILWTAGTPVLAADLTYSPGTPTASNVPDRTGTYTALVRTVAAGCDSPCTGTTEETVEAVTGQTVITDNAVYTVPDADTVNVGVGDILPPLSPVGEAWELHRLGWPLPALDRVTLPADFFPLAGVDNPVSFVNAAVTTVVDTADDRTRIRWALGGTRDDVDAVWAAGHAWGTGDGERTLAEALDIRTNPTTEPTAGNLPTSVNPMSILCREVFAGTGYVLIARPDNFGPAAGTLAQLTAAAAIAAGPYAAVIVWEDEQPAPAQTSPTA